MEKQASKGGEVGKTLDEVIKGVHWTEGNRGQDGEEG